MPGIYHAGYATIDYSPEDISRPDVHGVVMDLSNDEMKRLTAMEAGYDVKDVVVTSLDGTRYHSKAFTSNWSVRLFEESAPTHDYIGKLLSGAEYHSLPTQYQVRDAHPQEYLCILWIGMHQRSRKAVVICTQVHVWIVASYGIQFRY